MTISATSDKNVIGSQGQEPEDDLEALRQLLLKPEQKQLEQLEERLNDPVLHAREVSRVLPEAMLLSAKRDGKLATALAPTVEEIVRFSVRKDIHSFADALFPIIGPAIRKAISETLKQMIQSLNHALDRSFSWQGIRWRLESTRSGKPFAEIVLLHSLIFRVEQVFLIHHETGVLLQHVSNASQTFQDADLVSGMLTAIQDFVRDSFEVKKNHTLNSIQIGDFSVWIEQGPDLVIAGAIRGNAPEDLRLVFHNALENIHLEQRDVLAGFDGDISTFEPARYQLESCLRTQFRDKPRKFSPLLVILALAVLGIAGLWAFQSTRIDRYWAEYLEKLDAEPGIVVTEISEQDGVYRVSGLRDPLARKPVEILAATPLDPERVLHRFRPYQALSGDLVLERARRILAPPETVDLGFDNRLLRIYGEAPYQWFEDTIKLARVLPGVLQLDVTGLKAKIDLSPLDAPDSVDLTLQEGFLTATGTASQSWIESARDRAQTVPGITGYDDREVKIDPDLSRLDAPDSVELSLKSGILIATGSATHAWIVMARERVPGIQGIVRYDDTGVQNTDLSGLMALRNTLEREVILFEFNTSRYAVEEDRLKRILTNIVRINEQAPVAGKHVHIQIVGHSDSSGDRQHNIGLSQSRAEAFRNYLITSGINPGTISAIGVGMDDPVKADELLGQDKKMNRSVTFRVRITDKANNTQ